MINFNTLKDIREDHDLSQKEISVILGVERSTYSLWELGINIIPLKNLCDFADYFNYTIDYTLGLSNNRSIKNLKNGIDFNILGNNLKEIRIKNHLSQKELANIIGVTQACIAKYEKATIEISISNLYKYSKKFNISLTELCSKIDIDIDIKVNN